MKVECCPVHGDIGDPMDAWPCPDDCTHFALELERRVENVQVHGNYFKLLGPIGDGAGLMQEYRNHVPVGPPRPLRGRR